MNRGNLIWGTILLLLGGLMLADAAGLRLAGGASPMDVFWPLLLILAGIWVLWGAVRRGQTAVTEASIESQGASEAEVEINHSAGHLKVRSGATGTLLARGMFGGGLWHSAHLTGTRLQVQMRPAREPAIYLLGPAVNLDWDVQFNGDLPLFLRIQTGANRAEMDLQDLQIRDLKLETGASQTKILLPGRGRLNADFDLGAASLEVIFPPGVAGRIRLDQGVSSVSVDETRFPYRQGVYQSPDFDTAPNAVDLKIDAGAAQIRIR